MKKLTQNTLFFMILCLCTAHTLFGQYRGASRVTGFEKQNFRSVSRQFPSVSSHSTCIRSTTTTPRSYRTRTTYQPQRDLSISKGSGEGQGSLRKILWQLTPHQDRTLQLITKLKRTIELADADDSLNELVELFNKEDILNDAIHGLTPLELAIQYSSIPRYSLARDRAFQERLIRTLITHGAELHGAHELKFARNHNNIGAIQALLPYYDNEILSSFYATLQDKLSRNLKYFEDLHTLVAYKETDISTLHKYKDLEERVSFLDNLRATATEVQERINNLKDIKKLVEDELGKRTILGKKESELK